jgi:DNA repair protein RadD
VELFPDQQQFLAGLRASIKQGRRSPLGVAPTGFGKTVVFSYLASRIAARGKRTFALCHRDELTDQISGTMRAFDVKHGVVSPGLAYNPAYLTHVGNVFTVVRRLDRIAVPDYAIVDEGHHATLKSTWGKVIAGWRKRNPALVVIGVTATAGRLDGTGLGDVYDDLILGPSVADLIAAGRLSDYTLYAPKGIDMRGVSRRAGDFAKDEMNAAVDKPSITGDMVTHYRKYAAGKRAIVRGCSIAHSTHIAQAFMDAGTQAVHIDGGCDKATRRDAIRDFREGRVLVLTQVDLANEGFDLPAIEAAIDGRPTQSLTLALQFWGRALRVFPGKGKAILLDHAGNAARHGLPDDPREWSLEGRPASKKERDPDDVLIRQCKSCGAISRAFMSTCRECGAAFLQKPRTVAQVDGELEEVDPAVARAARVQEERAAGKTLEGVQALAQQRGYKPGWATHRWEAIQKYRRRA